MERIKKGSFTVEAAFIMPVVLAVVFGILKSGLMLHDEAVLEAAVTGVLEKGEMALKHTGDIETGRPDYENLLLREKGKAGLETCEKQLEEELLELFLLKKVSGITVHTTASFLGEEKIELWGNAGKRSLTVWNPAEYKRRRSR